MKTEELLQTPLTPKILKKNGFEGIAAYTWMDNMFTVSLFHWNSDEWEIIVENGGRFPMVRLCIAYIQQLQDILRLCRINKQIYV